MHLSLEADPLIIDALDVVLYSISNCIDSREQGENSVNSHRKLNTHLLPGGDASRTAFSVLTLPKKPGLAIKISWTQQNEPATYLGTTACLVCHSDYQENFKQHGHKLGLQVPGNRTALQDISSHPSFDDFLVKFTEAAAYTDPGVKVLFFEGYDSTRSFDKWKVLEDAPVGTPMVKVYLWKTSGTYKVTMENLVNAGDPPRTYTVALTYGGAVFKSRLLLSLPGRKGRYPFLQFQSFSGTPSDGSNAFYDRTRTEFRDYHMDWFFNAGTGLFTIPAASKTMEGSCLGCHATGYTQWQDPGTGEILSDAVDDVNGAFDIDGDGGLDEINIGCEVCHGPGSKHRTEALKGPELIGKTMVPNGGKFIVNPKYLTAGRSSMICGRCHDRPQGNSALQKNDIPLDAAGNFPPPGISRDEFLANYTSRKGAALSDFWDDQLHSKSHHQQYTDWLRSSHARNGEKLVACSHCHEAHGPDNAPYRGFLKHDPDDPNSMLCQECHAIDVSEHTEEYTGDNMTGSGTACVECHMPKTAKTGAGRYGLLLGTPTGASSDANIVYWENDISSHLMDVPSKWSKGVASTQPGKAMPTPYTNRCGTCHDPSALPYYPPEP